MTQVTHTAIEKLRREHKEFKGDRYEAVMKDAVLEALLSFCEQNAEFADAVAVEDKSFGGAMATVRKAVRGGVLSDIGAYRAAVGYYFPGAVVDYVMTIRMSAFEERALPSSPAPASDRTAKILSLNLSDFF